MTKGRDNSGTFVDLVNATREKGSQEVHVTGIRCIDQRMNITRWLGKKADFAQVHTTPGAIFALSPAHEATHEHIRILSSRFAAPKLFPIIAHDDCAGNMKLLNMVLGEEEFAAFYDNFLPTEMIAAFKQAYSAGAPKEELRNALSASTALVSAANLMRFRLPDGRTFEEYALKENVLVAPLYWQFNAEKLPAKMLQYNPWEIDDKRVIELSDFEEGIRRFTELVAESRQNEVFASFTR